MNYKFITAVAVAAYVALKSRQFGISDLLPYV